MPPRLKRARSAPPARSAEVLDVHGAAALLIVSVDTVYELFGRGELPGRKVGRKWITTRSAVHIGNVRNNNPNLVEPIVLR